MQNLNTRERKRSTNLEWYRVEEEARNDGICHSDRICHFIGAVLTFWSSSDGRSSNYREISKYRSSMVFDKYIKLCSIDQKDIRFIKNELPDKKSDKCRPILSQVDDQSQWLILRLTNNLNLVQSPFPGSKIDGNWVSLICDRVFLTTNESEVGILTNSTPTQKLKGGFFIFSSKHVGLSLASFAIIFRARQSELLRLEFHSLSSKSLKSKNSTYLWQNYIHQRWIKIFCQVC